MFFYSQCPCIRLARGKFEYKLTNQDSAGGKKSSVLKSSKQVRKGFEIRQLFSLKMATKFLEYLNTRHPNIKFTTEFEENHQIPFLDVRIKRNLNTFTTTVHRKTTFTGLYTKWDSFTPRKYKINLIRTLTYRCLRICSSSSLLQLALVDLKKTLLQNGYPRGVLCSNINHVLNRQKNKPAEPITTVPKKDIFRILPFLGSQSEVLARRVKSCVSKFYGFVNLKVIFNNTCRVKSFFPFIT